MAIVRYISGGSPTKGLDRRSGRSTIFKILNVVPLSRGPTSLKRFHVTIWYIIYHMIIYRCQIRLVTSCRFPSTGPGFARRCSRRRDGGQRYSMASGRQMGVTKRKNQYVKKKNTKTRGVRHSFLGVAWLKHHWLSPKHFYFSAVRFTDDTRQQISG